MEIEIMNGMEYRNLESNVFVVMSSEIHLKYVLKTINCVDNYTCYPFYILNRKIGNDIEE